MDSLKIILKNCVNGINEFIPDMICLYYGNNPVIQK